MDCTTFLINLDRSRVRLIRIMAQAQAIGLDFERVPGVDGYDVPDDLRGHFFPDGSTSSPLAAGEVGCYASHMKVWKLILERQLTQALMLEDAILPAI